MGCWNETCSISNLPILYGEEVVLIPLISNNILLNGESCYITDAYTPLSLPIYGKYNDYGGVEDAKTIKENEEFLLNLNFYEFSDNSCNALSKDLVLEAFDHATLKNPEYLLRAIVNKRDKTPKTYNSLDEMFECLDPENTILKYAKYYSGDEYKNMNYMMIHKDLYKKLVDEVSSRTPLNKEETIRDLMRERIIEYIKFMRDNSLTCTKDLAAFFGSHVENLRLYETPNISPLRYNYFIGKLIEKDNKELLEALLDAIMFDEALCSMRKGYFITSGQGSQDMEYHLHEILANFIMEHSEEVVKVIAGDYYDFVEDNRNFLISYAACWHDNLVDYDKILKNKF
jgi:hypothetical protein